MPGIDSARARSLLDAPAGDGDELDAMLDVALEDRDRVVAVQPVLSQLVHAHPHTHDEVRPAPRLAPRR